MEVKEKMTERDNAFEVHAAFPVVDDDLDKMYEIQDMMEKIVLRRIGFSGCGAGSWASGDSCATWRSLGWEGLSEQEAKELLGELQTLVGDGEGGKAAVPGLKLRIANSFDLASGETGGGSNG